ncbi:hypothetical protein DRH29_01595 [candidate division Kazan bacterium]|uniref:Class I SAM-dependent methyltransferase n=1 Tax=candidate division Kazan bacterium TaxID=2202143 RepID=A0A420ZD73_UNCK3|nr:MAG: hypothetical protein DRH29_01595 [candidate division Kazan bacterium]
MELAEYTRMERYEKNYWWHIGRRYILGQILTKFVTPTGKLNVLDLGCGTGINFSWLKKWGVVTGLDNEPNALSYCRQKSAYHRLIQDDATRPSSEKYDLITAFDLLEHMEDDRLALRRWHSNLTPSGYLLLTVPAHQWLFGAHDKALHHKRRYSSFELSQKIRAAGFKIKFLSPFFFFVFPVFVVIRLVKKYAKPETTYETVSDAIHLNGFLVWLSKLEAYLLTSGIGLPWGSSILVVATKDLK